MIEAVIWMIFWIPICIFMEGWRIMRGKEELEATENNLIGILGIILYIGILIGLYFLAINYK